uniref:Uncharacterized protein n=1 Tax=Ditylenchus dipsaci TaxID=166011 RepID=A0A915CKP4_9BILA
MPLDFCGSVIPISTRRVKLTNFAIYSHTFWPYISTFYVSRSACYFLETWDSPLADQLKRNKYVDNLFVEAADPTEGQHKCQELIQIFNSAEMDLREFFLIVKKLKEAYWRQ